MINIDCRAYPKYGCWAHNLFVLWALSFLQRVILCSATQIHSCLPKLFSLPHRVIPFLPQSNHSFLSMFPLELPTPSFSFNPSIYSLRWVEALWLLPLPNANGGPILSFVSGCSVESGSNGIETGSHLKQTARQRYSPRQYRAVET